MTVEAPATHPADPVPQGFSDDGVDEDDEVCSDPFEEGCRESLADGAGYDGACGSCADRLEAAGHWS